MDKKESSDRYIASVVEKLLKPCVPRLRKAIGALKKELSVLQLQIHDPCPEWPTIIDDSG
uniref:Uncharacterized protein n=1 Tax=Medicago truncatula TaxID=3880 RepID=A2Q610_MEDTR|nr:hypothetical protein MtrDRAFT_AC172742g14v1 [Medicago truncatula]